MVEYLLMHIMLFEFLAYKLCSVIIFLIMVTWRSYSNFNY